MPDSILLGSRGPCIKLQASGGNAEGEEFGNGSVGVRVEWRASWRCTPRDRPPTFAVFT